MKACFIDVETTGLDPVKNGIIQISGDIFSDERLVVPFNFKVAPLPIDAISATALSVSGTTREDISGFPTPQKVKLLLTNIFAKQVDKYDSKDKMFFIGYNAYFDMQFMREWFRKLGDTYFGSYFWYPPIDVMILAGYKLMSVRKDMPDFKLHSVAKQLGITVDSSRLHDAYYDIELTKQICCQLKLSF